ncbi:MFS transporter [Desulfosporosinus sp. PR]|uniref:MFS transporter n=1 Tax=Candidatus Desulfosporosinus nitrosoreducens TaxID=3401928 RepID=UPI0027F47CB4|nr:MFS transporter [Desulfosporosinus sp. PR]MDQ7096358.1 MFS transporter [Desulfosporosinus sp. PR]
MRNQTIKSFAPINKKKLAIQFILLFGIISAFGDITYEGAQSVYGPYLGYLGASAGTVGIITGIGGFLGYALRLVSGYFIDRTQKYWLITILGYGLLIAVPLLAIAGKWPIAALLIIIERSGKAIRSPGKDTMLSHATKQLGTGFGFGLHEALDQMGAFIGPLIFTTSLALTGGFKSGFTVMWVPALLTVVIALYVRHKVPEPKMLEENLPETKSLTNSPESLPRVFWVYAVFTFVSVVGFANYQIISYHLQVQKVIPEAQIPTLYAVAMAIAAITAIIIGKTYDKIGFAALIAVPVLTLPIGFLGFSKNPLFVIIAVLLWGAAISTQETIMRAAIADITTVTNRGKAYGIFNTIYGLALLISGVAMGFLYQYSIPALTGYIVIAELFACLAFIVFKKNIVKSLNL